ncbi:transposase [Candidatus Palauibacter sp.]|uniref:transposase n=1 Tax=Candidatus Palauibacter sp. TaxID=3101350 RepID=UPI003B02D23A
MARRTARSVAAGTEDGPRLRIKLAFEAFWDLPPRLAATYLEKWCSWAAESGLQPVIDAAKTIGKHWDGILLWFRSRISNGMIEGINSLVQAAKARARGYRTTENFITIAYLVCGKLNFKLPT